MAHELRSPLTGVKGFVQALLNRWDKLNDEQKKLMLTTVHADSDRLSRLIAELLDVARIDTGRLSLLPAPSTRTSWSAGSSTSCRPAPRARSSYVAEDELPEIFVDPDKFTQVVTNLVENGVRHGEGTVRVTVTRRWASDDEFPGVRVVVEDEGEGIAPEMRRRVFTKFWTSGVRGGSGLGLYLVNGLVRAHGGTVVIGDAPSGRRPDRAHLAAEDHRVQPTLSGAGSLGSAPRGRAGPPAPSPWRPARSSSSTSSAQDADLGRVHGLPDVDLAGVVPGVRGRWRRSRPATGTSRSAGTTAPAASGSGRRRR